MQDKPDKSTSQISFFGKSEPQQKNPENTGNDIYESSEQYDTENQSDSESIQTPVSIPEIIPIPDTSEYNQTVPESEIPPEHTVSPQTVESAPAVAVKKKSKKHKFCFDFRYENSIILTFLVFVGNSISKLFRNSLTAALFTSFHKNSELFRESYIYSVLFSSKTEKITTKIKKNIRKIATEAKIPALIGRFCATLMQIRTRIYGLGLMSFGITSILIHFFVSRYFDFFNYDIYAPITGAVIIFGSVFLMIYGKTASDALKESVLLSTLLFGFLGIKRPAFNENEEFYFPGSGACIIGALLGALTLFFPSYVVILFILIVIYTLIVIKYTETGVISLILIIPFLNDIALFYICTVITVSYIFKILTGKRTPDFEFTDIFIAAFMLLTFLSSIITFGEPSDIFGSCAFILVYFLCICTLRDPAWFERAVNSILLEVSLFAAYSVFVSYLGKNLNFDFDYIPNTDLGNELSSVLNSSAILGIALLCGIFYLISAFFTAKSVTARFAYLIFSVASVIFLFRETSVAVRAALLISLIIFLILKSGKTVIFVILGAAVLPILPLFSPDIYSGITGLFEKELYRNDIWIAVINMFGKYGLSGIGNGSQAFSKIYSSYYVGVPEYVPHAHSLFLQITISLGIFGVLLLILIIFFILQGAFSYGRNCTDKSSKNRLFCYAGMCSVIALSICGIFEYIWFNPRIMLFFWLFCGMSVCARRSAKDISETTEFSFEQEYNGWTL